MADLSDYMNAIALGTQASDITGNSTDTLTAGGFAAFTQAVTGSIPSIMTVPPTVAGGKNTAKMVFTPDQAAKIEQWIESQIFGFMKPSAQTLDIALGPVIMPLILKFVLPAIVLIAAAGWFGHRYLKG